nr:hypothetical protein [uncultured bacterium]
MMDVDIVVDVTGKLLISPYSFSWNMSDDSFHPHLDERRDSGRRLDVHGLFGRVKDESPYGKPLNFYGSWNLRLFASREGKLGNGHVLLGRQTDSRLSLQMFPSITPSTTEASSRMRKGWRSSASCWGKGMSRRISGQKDIFLCRTLPSQGKAPASYDFTKKV